MAWNISTGLRDALLQAEPGSVTVIADTISFGDGDGSVITDADTINDSGSGFGAIGEHDYVLIMGAGSGANENIYCKVLNQTTAKLEVEAGTLTAVSAGTSLCIAVISSGSVQEIFKNGVIDIYTTSRPATADLVEAGTKLLSITKDGGTFVAGQSANGLNLGVLTAGVLKRATDPETAATEVWRGIGIADGTAGNARWYANDKTTGASSVAIRMDGVVATSGGDLNMVNGTTVATDVYSEVSDVEVTMGTV